MNGRSRSTASRPIGSTGRATCGSRGSRRTNRAVTRITVAMNQTIARYASIVSTASTRPLITAPSPNPTFNDERWYAMAVTRSAGGAR